MGILSDVEGLRRRAQKHIESGAITDEYNADRAEVSIHLIRYWQLN